MGRAFVLTGGASLGSIQVGMATALAEAGIEPDLIVGSSVGAINGAWLASGNPASELAQVWRGLRRSELFPLRPLVRLRGFVGLRSHFVPNSGLRRLLEHHVAFAHLEDAPVLPPRHAAAGPSPPQPALTGILASATFPNDPPAAGGS